jgi:hypothetical protein
MERRFPGAAPRQRFRHSRPKRPLDTRPSRGARERDTWERAAARAGGGNAAEHDGVGNPSKDY